MRSVSILHITDGGYGTNSYLCTYDLYGPVRNDFDACRSITRASERGLGPKKSKMENTGILFPPPSIMHSR